MFDWIKAGTRLRCINPYTCQSYDDILRPAEIKVGDEVEILRVGPGPVRCGSETLLIDDIHPGYAVIGWFDFGFGPNGYYSFLPDDLAHFFKPVEVPPPTRERPSLPMIVNHNPSRPGEETKAEFIGFWAASADPDACEYAQKGYPLPWPADYVDEGWDAQERAMVAEYLKNAPRNDSYRGSSYCRFRCGAKMGYFEHTDGVYVWPQGFAHYIENHGVKPPQEFIDYVRRRSLEQPFMQLFRPVGRAEMNLISDSRYLRFPPRLPEQPIFYPICNVEYASEIAQKWNTKDGGTWYVTAFWVYREFLENYETHIVGASHHEEYWIPAEDLDAFNDAIVGQVVVIKRYDGK